jgi:protein-S-isoprenylcysteine O-methyltransferase Ste14
MAAERDLEKVSVYSAPDDVGPSASSLIGGIVADLQALVRKEIALARQETVEELNKLKTALIALAMAGAVVVVGGLLLVLALAKGLADLLNWPEWSGYAIVGVLLAIVGAILIASAQKRFKTFHPIPEKTVETVKENVEWLKERTIAKT